MLSCTKPKRWEKTALAAKPITVSFHVWFWLVLIAAGVQLVALWWRSTHPVLDILANFCWFAWVVVAITTVMALIRRYYQRAITLGFILALLSIYVAEYFYRAPITPPTDRSLTVVSFNVNGANPRRDDIIGYLNTLSPDIVLLVEVDQRWSALLNRYRDQLGYMIAHYQDDNFGIALLSKYELNGSVLQVTEQQIPLIHASVKLPQQQLQVVGVHTLPPLSHEYWSLSIEQITTALALFDRTTAPSILLGDINATPNGTLYRMIVDHGMLIPAGFGRRLWPTWGIGTLSLLQLDHIFISRQLAVNSDQLGLNIGSDHRAVITTISLY